MTINIIESEGDVDLDRGGKILATRLDNAMLALEEKQNEFANYLQEIKRREEEVKKIKDALYDQMSEQGIKKIDTNRLLITTVNPKPRRTLDFDKMKAMKPKFYDELFEKWGKDTKVKGYARVTVKKENI